MIYDHVGGIRDPWKHDLALEFCRNQNKVISILTETNVNHNQIQMLESHLFISWSHTRFLPLMTEFPEFMPLQGILPGNFKD